MRFVQHLHLTLCALALSQCLVAAAGHAQTTVTTTGGTNGHVPVFTGASTIGNSILYATPTALGIGLPPSSYGVLDVGGQSIFRGPLNVARTGNASASTGTNSNPLLFSFQFYNSTAKFVYNPYFSFQAEAKGNNTANPAGTMNLLYYNGIGGVPKETGLSFNTNGTINFSPAQTFPIAAGPQGPAGPAGPAGATGPQGPAGGLSLPYFGDGSSGPGYALITLSNAGNGHGLVATGGTAYDGNGYQGGIGVQGYGGNSYGDPYFPTRAGYGVYAMGGSATNPADTDGDAGYFQGGGNSGNGISAYGANPYGSGIYAVGGSGSSTSTFVAGYFVGNVEVTGSISKASGSFKIDDPIDPENKYLYHSFVESPDMKNIYDGNVTTDSRGEAVVTMPPYFEALNTDFRYQLTTIGSFSRAMVASEISNGKFVIRTEQGNVKVSWQVTGVRQDAWANAHRIPDEVDKAEQDKGHYLHPELFGHAGEASIAERNHPRPRSPQTAQ